MPITRRAALSGAAAATAVAALPAPLAANPVDDVPWFFQHEPGRWVGCRSVCGYVGEGLYALEVSANDLVLMHAQRRGGRIWLSTEHLDDYPVPIAWFTRRVRGKATGEWVSLE